VQFGLILLVAVVLFAWIKGGAGERVGASAVALAWIGCVAVQVLAPASLRPMVFLGFDFALASALLVAALRFPSFWLGATMMLQSFALAVHAFHLEDGVREEGFGKAYVTVLNATSACVLLTLAASTAAAWMKRRKAGRVAAAHAAPSAVTTA
jgi:hypothetical protein